jgi:GNAT superfamily N-acetyltransferase
MEIRVQEAEDADMYRMFEICSLAYTRSEPFWDACWPEHWTEAGRRQGAERWKDINHADPDTTFLKAVDENGTIIGMAKWNFYVDTVRDLPKEASEDGGEYWSNETDKAFAKELLQDFLKLRQGAIDRTGGNLANLDILAIHPAYQRRGAGARLVEWGTKKADDLGIEAVVESSIFGRGLYVCYHLAGLVQDL